MESCNDGFVLLPFCVVIIRTMQVCVFYSSVAGFDLGFKINYEHIKKVLLTTAIAENLSDVHFEAKDEGGSACNLLIACLVGASYFVFVCEQCNRRKKSPKL